jgi:phage repressor protein C with HTH and peptisase S24 domain
MELFPTPVRPDAFQSSRVRLHRVESDNMEPTLRARWDYVVCAPTDRYDGEGLYLFDIMGAVCIYRCQSGGDGKLMQLSDNKHYATHIVSPEQFATTVLAKVVADVKVRDDHALRTLAA